MLVHANVDQFYWVETVQTAVHCKNVFPTVAFAGVTPYEKLSGG